MKSLKRVFALALLSLLAVMTIGCEKSNNAPFIGTWKHTEVFTDGHEVDTKITFYDDDDFKMVGRYYDAEGDFVEDNSYEKTGNYSFSGTTITFFYKDKDGDDYKDGVAYSYYVVDGKRLYIEVEAGKYNEFVK